MHFEFHFCEFIAVLGMEGQVLPNERDRGWLEHRTEPFKELEEVNRIIFEMKSLEMKLKMEKSQQAIILEYSVQQMEIREALAGQGSRGVFDKIFFWRKADQEGKQVEGTICMQTQFVDFEYANDALNIEREVPQQSITIHVDMKQTSFFANLETIQRVLT